MLKHLFVTSTFLSVFFFLFCSLVGALGVAWHPDPLSESACENGSRFPLDGSGGIWWTDYSVLGSSTFTQACGGDALSLRVLSFLSFPRQWRGRAWMDRGGGWDGGKGGFSGEPNLCTILPMALGQSRLVNYAVSCSICLCLAGKRWPVLVDMQQSRVSGLEGGSYCMWHVSVTFRRAPDLSQWWCSHVTKDGWASWGTFVRLCGREEWTWTESVRGFPLCVFFIASTYESTAGCIYRVIKGIVHTPPKFIYSTSCFSKHVWLAFLCGMQKMKVLKDVSTVFFI